MANNIQIEISANVSSAVQGINQVNQKLDQLAAENEKTRKSFTALAAGFSAIATAGSVVFGVIQKIGQAVESTITAYGAQTQAEIRLQSTLKATSNAIGMTATELVSLAESISQVTTYSDQEVLAVEQMLAATRKISADIVPEATMAILDMAAATGDDAAGAAHDLAQALSDPAGEIESLKEKGIQLTEAQAENIKKVQEQNGLYEAQKLLLKEVEGTYGGIAQALANTDTGKIDQLKNAWTDLKEGLGEMLMNSLDGVLDYTLSLVEKVEGFVSSHNKTTRDWNAVNYALSSGSTDMAAFDEEGLNRLIYASAYRQYMDAMPADIDRDFYESQGLAMGRFTQEDRAAYNAAVNEINTRNQMSVWRALDAAYGGAKPVRVNSSPEEILANQMAYWSAYDSKIKGETESASTTTSVAGPDVSAFIASNRALSTSAQIAYLQEQINSAQTMRWNTEYGSDEYNQIVEIIGALEQQKKALIEVSEATEGLTESQRAAEKALASFQEAQKYINPVMDLTTSLGDLFSNLADTASDALDEIESRWDEYFDELDKKQERQNDSLNALLASGNISYEDYIKAMDELDEERASAESKRAEEEKEARDKANEYGQAAFAAQQANALAQVAIDTASAIMGAWADNPNPITAGIVTGLIAAASTAQIAAISSQQYTPMATGGIVTKPTYALIGEGGAKEAVLPLTDENLDRVGLKGSSEGTIVINISIGASYTGDQLANDVFRGIEMAQRTGALPKWRYA